MFNQDMDQFYINKKSKESIGNIYWIW